MSPFHHDFAAVVLADDAVCACVDGVAQAAVTLESSADYPPVPPSPVPLPALRPFALALEGWKRATFSPCQRPVEGDGYADDMSDSGCGVAESKAAGTFTPGN